LNTLTPTYNYDSNKLIWAIIASFLLHATFAYVVPSFTFEFKKEKPPVLKIEIQQPAPPAPVIPEPEIIKPEPPKPVVKPKPKKKKPKLKPKPKPVPIPEPVVTEPITPEPVENTPPPAPEVIAVAPTVEKAPAVIVPPPPPSPPKPTQVEVNNALGEYGSLLGRRIAKHKSYPKIAARRGWQGKVLLDLTIDNTGRVLSAKIKQSSGHKVLDKQALKMVEKASPFPTPPLALRDGNFNLTVPVSFKLANG